MAYPLPDVSSEDYNAAQAAKFAAATQPVLDHLDTSPDTPPPDPTLSPNQQVVKSGGTPSLRSRNLISNQFSYIDDQELTPAEAMAACGPTAALAFARYAGRNPTIGEALRLAKQNGWTPSLGMAGPQSEVSLLGQLGVHSQYNQGASPNDVAAEVQAGRPVIVDTPQHYFAIDDFNPQTGLFHVGGSGLALRGGSEWMSWQQIAAHGGGARGSITIQSPSGQPLGLPGPRASASPPAGAPPVSFESYARQALATIDQGVQSIAGQPDATSQRANVANSPNSSNPSGSPSFATFARNLMATLDGGGSPQNASQPRSGAATGTQQAPEVSQAAVPGYNDMAGALSSPIQPYSSQYGQPPGIQGPPPMQDTGATNGSGGDVPQPDYSGLPGYGGVQPAPGANPLVNIPQAIGQRIGDTAEQYNAAYTPTLPSQPGHGPLARFTPAQLQAQQELAIGAVLGVQGEAPKIVGEAAAPLAERVGEEAQGIGSSLIGKAKEAVTRMFHGTGSAFDAPEAAKFDPNGLFGPGYYLTDDARVASSYADKGQAVGAQQTLQARADAIRARGRPGDDLLAKQIEEQIQPTAPQVRAVNVPQGLRLLDADAPLTVQQARAISDAIPVGADRDNFDIHIFPNDARTSVNRDVTGADAFLSLTRISEGDKDWVNAQIQRAGYDGIRYNGGQRIPLADEHGAPIQHTAVVIFPESLPKITNAISGRPMGSPPGVGGAVLGGAIGYSQPADTQQQRQENALKGAAIGGVAGYGLGQLGTSGLLAQGGKAAARAINEWIAPARNTPVEVQGLLRDFANARLQGQVDAETLGLQAKKVLGPAADTAATASHFEQTGLTHPNPTPEQAAFSAKVKQFTNDTRDVGLQHGYINGDVTAGPTAQVQAYFPHVYQENLTRATTAARKSGLNPNDFYSNGRVYPTLADAQAAGLNPVDSFSGPLQHYAQRVSDSEAKYQLVDGLKNASPAAAIPYKPGQKLPDGWVPGMSTVPQFAGYAFPEPVAKAINNIVSPSGLSNYTLGRGYQTVVGEAKSLLFSLSGFHNVTELRQAISANGVRGVPVVIESLKNGFVPGAWDEFRLTRAPLISAAAKAGVTGLAGGGKALDVEGGASGLAGVALRSAAGAVSGAASGYGIGTASGADPKTRLEYALAGAVGGAAAGPLMKPIANSLWERQVPTLKALTWQIQVAAGRDPKAAADFVNNTYGGQNLAAIARSKSVQDAARFTFLAPDWWESWTNQLGNAFKPGDAGGMARAYWARTAITSAATLEGLNYALNHHFTDQNDPDHANQLEVTGLYKLLGVERRDPKTGAPVREYMSVLPSPIEALLNLSQGHVVRFGAGRMGLIPRIAAEQLANKDYRGRDIVPPYTPTLESAKLRAASVLGQISPIGVQQAETSTAGAEPASIAAFASATGLRTSPAAKSTYQGPQISQRSYDALQQAGVNWTPTPVGDSIDGFGLTRDERTRYQTLADQETEAAIQKLTSKESWQNLSALDKRSVLDEVISGVRDDAATQVLRSIPRAELKKRVTVATQAKTVAASR